MFATTQRPHQAAKLLLFSLLFVIILALPFSAHAGVTHLEGFIHDAESGEPLHGATVLIEGTRNGVSTDADGRFLLLRLPSDDFDLIVSYLGYRPEKIRVHPHDLPEDGLSIKLEASAFELNSVVVTGTRSQRYIEDAPVRTEVISSRDLEMRSAANLFEALETAPGVRVESQCQACNFTEVRMNGLGSAHTQVLMDGQPVYSGLASVYGLQQFSTAEVDRIEIVKGAGSALYGSNAIAGVVNIITERPAVDQLKGGFEVGQFGTNQFDATASRVQARSAYSIFAQLNQEASIDETADGLNRDQVNAKDGITDRVKSDLRNIGANAYFDGVITEQDEVTVRFRYLNEKRIGGELLNDAYLNPYTLGTEHITTDRLSATLGYRTEFSADNGIEMQVTGVSHNRDATNDTYLNDYMATHDDAEPDVNNLRPYLADERMFVFNTSYNHRLAKHHLTAGAQYSYDELEESGRYVIVDEADPQYGFDYTSISNKHSHDIGIYLQDEWRFARSWEMVAGVRTDFHNSEDSFEAEEEGLAQAFESTVYDEQSLNPRLAVKWAPTTSWTFRANMGTGFKVPYGFSEDLHLCSGSPRVWKGPSLKPESSRSFNLSADYSDYRMAFGVNGYVSELFDAVGIVNAGNQVRAKGYHYEYENVDNAMVYGLDFNVRYQIARRLQINADVSYFHGEYDDIRGDWAGTRYAEDSRNISRFPDVSGGIRLDWSPGNWESTVDLRYTGTMYIDYAVDGDLELPGSMVFETDPFFILNSQVSYKFNDGYRVYVGGRNLNDYLQPVKHTDDAAFYYAPVYGRMLYTGIRLNF